MNESPNREARLRPEFAHLYPAITPGQWDSAAVISDRMLAWLLRNPGRAGFIATARILPPEHFDFRGDSTRPESIPEGQSRRGDPR
ncbi:MAG TPA: hypothetical protein VIG08_16905 [Gemmatimonadales bacterium]|jgi:hypothetical protein